MTSQCEPGLGWPIDDPTKDDNLREEIVEQLIELREELEPDWSPKRAVWNFAILIAKGMVGKKKGG